MFYVNLYSNVWFRHGGAKGKTKSQSADFLVSKYFKNIEQVMRPQYSGTWTWEDRKAPFKRNIEMLETIPVPKLVCAFFYEKRKGGTLHQVNEAKKRNIPVVEFIQLTKQKSLLVK